MPKPAGFITPKYETTSDLKGGINVAAPADHIADNQFQDISNLVYLNGVLQVDTGFTQYGYRTAGNPLEIIQQELTTGSLLTCLVTTCAFYTWDAGISDWVLGMTPYLTTTTSNDITGTPWTVDYAQDYGPVITSGGTGGAVGSLDDVSVGDVVSILCTNGRYFTSTVTNVNTETNVVTYLDALLPGYVIAAGAPTNFYHPYHGGEYAISWVVDPTTNTLIWTNGVDPVQAFSGGTNAPLAGLYGDPTADPPVPPIATTARLVARYYGYTIAVGTTEGGSYLPFRFRYSTPVSSTDWTDYAAGFDDLTDTADAITSVGQVGGYLILGREQSIMRVSYWGTAVATWFFEYPVPSTGVLGNDALVNTRVASVVIADPGIYNYVGDYNLTSIGDAVYNLILGPEGDLSPQYAANLFLFYVNQLDELWVFYPTTGNEYCNKILRYSLRYGNWHVRNLQTQLAGCNIAYATSAYNWLEIVGSWQSRQGITWNQRASRGNFPFLLFASYSDRVTYKYDYNTKTDCSYDFITGVATALPIPWYFVSKDYPIMEEKLILDGVNAYGQGTALFEVSSDGGLSYQSIGTMNFGPSLSKQVLDFQATGDFFRYRVSGTDPTFQLSDISIRYLEASEY